MTTTDFSGFFLSFRSASSRHNFIQGESSRYSSEEELNVAETGENRGGPIAKDGSWRDPVEVDVCGEADEGEAERRRLLEAALRMGKDDDRGHY